MPTFNSPRMLSLHPCQDPWQASRERYWDIAGNPYHDFIAKLGTPEAFSYAAARLTLTYDAAPEGPYFAGRIEGSGLKPNFAYQLKLTGKPQRGSRGWGVYGDDWSNQALGLTGRWWCDSAHEAQTNFDDSHYHEHYKTAAPGNEHNMYGYQFMGCFVTDENGGVTHSFTGQNTYHVDWKEEQLSDERQASDAYVLNQQSPFVVESKTGYGYGAAVEPRPLNLWYEYEPGRARDAARLPAGRYNCRLLITEESFHDSELHGGYWRTVLATEDYRRDSSGEYVLQDGCLIPDADPANDVIFTVSDT